VPAFYALGRTRVPVMASVTAVIMNLAWNITTFRRFGHVGLAFGTSLAALVNFLVLVLTFERQIHGLIKRDLMLPLLKILAAAAVMGAAVWLISSRLEALPGAGTAMFAFKAFVPIGLGAMVYLGAARLFGVDEARGFARLFRRR
jgi:putative peptidoglycan lipid II flippase